MAAWDAAQYLKFEDERTRPAVDLLARIAIEAPRRCIDLGCGPGNSTALLAARFPNAELQGLDSSPDMLVQARPRLPDVHFSAGDIATWYAADPFDVIFANAALQWLPDHETLLPHLADQLASGGWLAVQMPDNLDEPSHAAMRETAADGPWKKRLAAAAGARTRIGSFDEHYAWLSDRCDIIDQWRTSYVHVLDGAPAIAEWVKGTGLRPFLEPLDTEARRNFLARYTSRIAELYPAQVDGKVLLRFPRRFIVVRRRG